MADNEHLSVLNQGVKAWNQYQKGLPRTPPLDLFRPDFIDADLSERNLSKAIFSGGRFMRTNFYGSKLDRANFEGGSISGAHLWKVSAVGASFEDGIGAEARFVNSDLRKACFRSMDASFMILQNVLLEGADFTHSEMQGTIICDCDLSGVVGLETIKHLGPSHVDLNTVQKSRGRIPEVFLRGCGVPESLVLAIRNITVPPGNTQFQSCFISYSSEDEKFARFLHKRMSEANLRVWFAPKSIQGGKKLHDQIEAAIHLYDKLLVVLSENSLRSEWVMTELRNARKAERTTGKRKLFPIRLIDMEKLSRWQCFDADSGKDLGVELREYFIPDFSRWTENRQFEPAFEQLLRDLKS